MRLSWQQHFRSEAVLLGSQRAESTHKCSRQTGQYYDLELIPRSAREAIEFQRTFNNRAVSESSEVSAINKCLQLMSVQESGMANERGEVEKKSFRWNRLVLSRRLLDGGRKPTTSRVFHMTESTCMSFRRIVTERNDGQLCTDRQRFRRARILPLPPHD